MQSAGRMTSWERREIILVLRTLVNLSANLKEVRWEGLYWLVWHRIGKIVGLLLISNEPFAFNEMSGSTWLASQQELFSMQIIMLTGGAAVRGKQFRCCTDVATRAWPQARGRGALQTLRLAWIAAAERRHWMRRFLLSPGTLRRVCSWTDISVILCHSTVHILAISISTNNYT